MAGYAVSTSAGTIYDPGTWTIEIPATGVHTPPAPVSLPPPPSTPISAPAAAPRAAPPAAVTPPSPTVQPATAFVPLHSQDTRDRALYLERIPKLPALQGPNRKGMIEEKLTPEVAIRLAKKLCSALPLEPDKRFDQYTSGPSVASFIAKCQAAHSLLRSPKKVRSPKLVQIANDRLQAANAAITMMRGYISTITADLQKRHLKPSTSGLYGEFLMIANKWPESTIRWPDKLLVIQTGEITAGGCKFGRFKICFKLEPYLKAICAGTVLESAQVLYSLLQTIPIDPVFGRQRADANNGEIVGRLNQYWHPHISSEGRLCYGDQASLACTKAANELRLFDVLELTETVLLSYHDSNPYVHIDSWQEGRTSAVQCNVCKERNAPNLAVGCGHNVCSSHRVRCNYCGGTVCSSCTDVCETPAHKIAKMCTGCVKRCKACSKGHCSACNTTCRRCRGAVCKDCYPTNKCYSCGSATCTSCVKKCKGCNTSSCSGCLNTIGTELFCARCSAVCSHGDCGRIHVKSESRICVSCGLGNCPDHIHPCENCELGMCHECAGEDFNPTGWRCNGCPARQSTTETSSVTETSPPTTESGSETTPTRERTASTNDSSTAGSARSTRRRANTGQRSSTRRRRSSSS